VVTAVDSESQTFVATLTLTAPRGTENPSAVITTVTALDSASHLVIATLTVTPMPEQDRATESGEVALPSLVTTVVTTVDSQSYTVLSASVYTTTVQTSEETAALTTVITAVDSVSRTVLTTLTLAPTSTPNIGDLVCSGIGGCTTATRVAPPGEFTGAAKRESDVAGLAVCAVVGLLGAVIALV